jgi:hypothetical protein
MQCAGTVSPCYGTLLPAYEPFYPDSSNALASRVWAFTLCGALVLRER